MTKIAFIQPRISYYNGGDEKRCLKTIEKTLQYTDYDIILYTTKINYEFQSENYKNFIQNTNSKSRVKIKELTIEKEYLFIDNNPNEDTNKWDVESFRFNSYLYKELEKDQPDIIWGFYISEGFIRPINIPAIHNQSGYLCDYVPVRESIFRQFSAVVCISKNVEKKWLEKLSTPFKKSYVLHSGPLTNLPLDYKKEFNKNESNILFVGRLIDWKGVEDLINSVYLIRDIAINWHLNIVGSGPCKNELQNLANQLIPDRVSFYDFSNDVESFYKKADLCVFPSREFEGLMNVVIESMSFGCPVIATSDNGNEEIIDDGIDGFIVQPRNIEMLANKINFVLSNKENMNDVSINAVKKIQNNFSWKKIINDLDIIVQDVINSNKI